MFYSVIVCLILYSLIVFQCMWQIIKSLNSWILESLFVLYCCLWQGCPWQPLPSSSSIKASTSSSSQQQNKRRCPSMKLYTVYINKSPKRKKKLQQNKGSSETTRCQSDPRRLPDGEDMSKWLSRPLCSIYPHTPRAGCPPSNAMLNRPLTTPDLGH